MHIDEGFREVGVEACVRAADNEDGGERRSGR